MSASLVDFLHALASSRQPNSRQIPSAKKGIHQRCEEQYYYDEKKETFNVDGKFKGKEITNIVLTELEENPDSFDMKIDATNMQCINKTIMFKSLTSTNSHEIMIDRYLKGCFCKGKHLGNHEDEDETSQL